jgi:hypothetical protein
LNSASGETRQRAVAFTIVVEGPLRQAALALVAGKRQRFTH